MYIMMFITYICIFSYKLPSDIHTFGLLLILSRFIGLPRYSYRPTTSEIFPPEYQVLRKDRNSKARGGGVFIAVRKHYDMTLQAS